MTEAAEIDRMIESGEAEVLLEYTDPTQEMVLRTVAVSNPNPELGITHDMVMQARPVDGGEWEHRSTGFAAEYTCPVSEGEQ
jgi:hypothetical protein